MREFIIGYDEYDRFRPTQRELERAVLVIYSNVGTDLGIEDPSDPNFVGYVGDRMCDSDVPEPVRDAVKDWCERSCRGNLTLPG
jgi:hypothetical protein